MLTILTEAEPLRWSTTSTDDSRVVIAVTGELEACTAPPLGAHLRALVDERPHGVVVDVADVTFLDAAGYGTLSDVGEHCRRAGVTAVLDGVPSCVELVFSILGPPRGFAASITEARHDGAGARPRLEHERQFRST